MLTVHMAASINMSCTILMDIVVLVSGAITPIKQSTSTSGNHGKGPELIII